jgi:hypothetical protein
MGTNRQLKSILLQKLGVTPQALSLRVQKKIKQLPMTTAEATYLIAHDVGLRLTDYLKADEIANVRHLQTQLNNSGSAAAGSFDRKVVTGRRAKGSHPREIRFANRMKVMSAVLAASKLTEAKEMAGLYPILYLLENSMREVVRRVMRARFGDNWWNTELVSGKLKNVRQKASDRMATEDSKHSWHQRRGAHPIDYVDLGDVGDIILAKQTTFIPDVLRCDTDWFKQFMKELEPSRNVLCHMNPLSETNARDLTTKFERWESLVRAGGSAIPSA